MENEIKITVIRSRRKTLGMEIRDGQVIIRAPLRSSQQEIRRFADMHRRWMVNHLAKYQAQKHEAMEAGVLSPEDVRKLARQARAVITQRVQHYAPLVGVTYGRIAIRSQRSRWGSCSSKGNLNFNCLLILSPPEVLDSVVVHELCHRREMNHSARFYAEVLRVFPEYHKWHRWLKENGGVLMQRLPERS